MSKDTIKVNMNIYDIPILVEQLKKLEQEIKDLQQRIDKAIEYIKSYNSTIKSRNELGIYVDFMSIPKELLEILGDKE